MMQVVVASGQAAPLDLPAIVAAGFRSIYCNRPDREGADQPSFREVVWETDVTAFDAAMAEQPKPILAEGGCGRRPSGPSCRASRPLPEILAERMQPASMTQAGVQVMVEDWSKMIAGMNEAVGTLHRASPEMMKAFGTLSRAAHAGGALDTTTKELIALAIGVAVRCAPCIAYHTEGALKAGASREAIAETLAMAVYMGAGPSVMYAAQALEATDQLISAAGP